MSFLRNRTNFQTRDDVDSDDERTPGQADESVLFQTGRAIRLQELVGEQTPNPILTQDRRNKARDALEAVRSAGNQLMGINLLSSLASSPVTDIVPPSAASQEVTKTDDLPSVAELTAVDGPTAREQVPIRRKKWFGKAQSRPLTLADIKNFMPIQLEYPPHPEEDRSNEWFQNAYSVLFERIVVLARDYFGFQKLQRGFHEPWAINMPDEFLRYTQLVAEPDPIVGGWDEILTDTKTRKYLIVGIIVRILEVKVFAPNLWGNTKEGEELLHSLDRALLDREGYSRQELRSKSIRTLLGGASITPNFHSDCSTLTAQIMLLFAPLFDYLTLLPARLDTVTPLPTALYQSLHNIVSNAAYLSLCIRISPTIIHLTHLVPGTPYSPEEHISIVPSSWTLSKTLIQENWARDHTVMEYKLAEAEGYQLGYENAGRLGSKAGRQAVQRFKAARKQLTEHKPPGYTHRASVKISLWPTTRRYWAGNGKPGGDMDGQSIFNLTNAGAIFYFRETDRAVDSLFDFVANKKKRCSARYNRARDILAIMGLLALGVILGLIYLVGWTEVQGWIEKILLRITEHLRYWIARGKGEAYRAYESFGAPSADWFDKAYARYASYVKMAENQYSRFKGG
ncbi:hypothetical protein DSL72_008596 [Monilinia vaccinii-corymbosi]|uniref:Uncharacterized protein n=1 Tax=Monilinia vaccinii-corymbosi TaxID=61207 RepID=A0A8A3PPX0_9HELO|nr:hypothetical protein DSL72_008596 [Monilinia vaccinii-corymbosi]